MALADELGMRSMRARCLLALGLAAREAGGAPGGARAAWPRPSSLLRDMDMAHWLATAERALATLDTPPV